jgi:hypothetical protein
MFHALCFSTFGFRYQWWRMMQGIRADYMRASTLDDKRSFVDMLNMGGEL